MRTSDTWARQLLALLCLIVTAFMLYFSQRAREMVTGLSSSPALRQHLVGRRLLMENLTRAPVAKFDDSDGHTNTAEQLKDDAWLASGFVEYDWRGRGGGIAGHVRSMCGRGECSLWKWSRRATRHRSLRARSR
jgi:hypothetical protein